MNLGSKLGLTNDDWNLIRPDYQLNLGGGNWATFDISTLGEAGKIKIYNSVRSPCLVNLIYGQIKL
jgi:hypothetical protein